MQKITDNYALNVYLRTMGLEEDNGDCNAKAVMRAILTLTEREQTVLEHRYRLGYTLKKTGEVFGVGAERVRQIEIKALRKLRHPSRSRDMSISSIIASRDYLSEQNAKQQAVITEQRRTIAQIAKLVPKEAREQNADTDLTQAISSQLMKINELDLSVRSYTCLMRAGCATVEDILESIKCYDDLCQIRNLGRRSMDEVIEKMREYGYSDWADKIEQGAKHND